MDRQIVYPGSIPLDTDLLTVERDTMKAIGALAQATLGTGPVFNGLVCAPTVPASMAVQVGAGSLTQVAEVDATAFGSLPIDPTPLVKIGSNAGATALALSAPVTAGTAVVWLVEAQFVEVDADPVVLPYYNAANPALPFSGPGGSGAPQPTQRLQQVALQAIAGAPAAIGAAVAPVSTAGWLPLAEVTVAAGVMQITGDLIVAVPTAPQLQYALPQLRPGFSSILAFSTSRSWTVPNGVSLLKVRLVGGGGGGGGGGVGFGGAGGGAGGSTEGIFPVVAGTAFWVAVGAGGGGSSPGATASFGGTSSFGSLCSATGGAGGGSSPSVSAGGVGGAGYGATLCLGGGCGQDGQGLGLTFAASGGGGAMGGGGRGAAGASTAMNATAPGAGGGGCYGVAGVGGNGASGVVVVEY
jgi:hypothetical protein